MDAIDLRTLVRGHAFRLHWHAWVEPVIGPARPATGPLPGTHPVAGWAVARPASQRQVRVTDQPLDLPAAARAAVAQVQVGRRRVEEGRW